MSDIRTMPAPRRMRTVEAAAYLGLAATTLEKMRSAGGGPAFAKLGRAVSYAVADLDAWTNARRVTNTAEARAVERRSKVAVVAGRTVP